MPGGKRLAKALAGHKALRESMLEVCVCVCACACACACVYVIVWPRACTAHFRFRCCSNLLSSSCQKHGLGDCGEAAFGTCSEQDKQRLQSCNGSQRGAGAGAGAGLGVGGVLPDVISTPTLRIRLTHPVRASSPPLYHMPVTTLMLLCDDSLMSLSLSPSLLACIH